MNRRSTYTPIAARGTYSSSRRIRLTITLSLFTVGAVALGLLAASLFGPVDAAFRPDAAGAVADEGFAADIPDTQEGSDGSLNQNEVTVFDTAHPAVARLNAALLEALQAAANEAAAEDITFYVNSGWRLAVAAIARATTRRSGRRVWLARGGAALGGHARTIRTCLRRRGRYRPFRRKLLAQLQRGTARHLPDLRERGMAF